MRFAQEVNCTAFDFLIAGALLIGAGFALELVVRRVGSVRARIAIAIAILAVVLLVWAQGAVGILQAKRSGPTAEHPIVCLRPKADLSGS